MQTRSSHLTCSYPSVNLNDPKTFYNIPAFHNFKKVDQTSHMIAAPAVAKTLSHEELFLQRYDQLLKWAAQLTKPDRELARDLVQESFLQFTLSAGDLTAVNNIDNYLYGLVRNTYISYLRRSARYLSLSFDIEVSESLGVTIDPLQQIHARDKLIAICQLACVRKDTSVAASLLILRFFHGYLPNEIAKLTHRSRNVVDVQLKLARLEVCGPAHERPGGKTKGIVSPPKKQTRSRSGGDLLVELREEILATRKGECLEPEQFNKIQHSRNPVPRNRLSHLVSCVRCLDQANRILGLPSLKERNVLDVLGRARGEDSGSRSLYSLVHSTIILVGYAIWTFLNSADALNLPDILT